MPDESRLGRKQRIRRVPIQKVRRDLQVYLERRGLEQPMVNFCRRYGILDRETGQLRRAEAARLVMYVAFMSKTPNRVQATVEAAVRSCKPMLVGSMMVRLQTMFATADHQPKGTGINTTSRVHLSLDDWLYRAMQSLERDYRAVDGVVDDIRMATDALRAGFNDPALDQIASLYMRRMEPVRENMRWIEEQNKRMLVHALGQERPIGELLRRTG